MDLLVVLHEEIVSGEGTALMLKYPCSRAGLADEVILPAGSQPS
jgi:hypothetical protein